MYCLLSTSLFLHQNQTSLYPSGLLGALTARKANLLCGLNDSLLFHPLLALLDTIFHVKLQIIFTTPQIL